LEVVFDEESLVADAGLLAAGALMGRLGVEAVVDRLVRLGGRAGGASPGRKVLSLVAAMLAGGDHIDHADRLRAGATRRVLRFAVMAPSTLGTFLRAFTWGCVRQLDKAAIKRIVVQNPEATVYPPCIDALREADLITIGPGSLFTTVIACLAFKEVAQAIRDSSALKVYVCNTTTQPGQTDDYSLSDHVQQVVSYLGLGILDYVVLNSTQPSPELMELYAREQVNVLLPTPDEIHKIKTMNVSPVLADVADTASGKRALWQKQDTIRHNPELIAAILLDLMSERLVVNLHE